ncbi:hypothetical protein P9112_000179 [Eukaryota sp. TZLM1-RC]
MSDAGERYSPGGVASSPPWKRSCQRNHIDNGENSPTLPESGPYPFFVSYLQPSHNPSIALGSSTIDQDQHNLPICTETSQVSSFSSVRTTTDRSHFNKEWSATPIDRKAGVKCISNSFRHTLLLTYSGEVYGWGDNEEGQVLCNGATIIKLISPIKLPLTNIVTISAGDCHSLALSSEGKLYGWGRNGDQQINMSKRVTLPITLIKIPYIIKEVYCARIGTVALTQDGQVVKWGDGKSFEIIKELTNIVSISVSDDSFVAIDGIGDFYYRNRYSLSKFFISCDYPYLSSNCTNPLRQCDLVADQMFVINASGEVCGFKCDDPFNNKPTKVSGLSNIVSISGSEGVYAVIDNNGKVFVWGDLSRISILQQLFKDEPICIDGLTNIEGISVGHDFLFAYNKNTVWAWGRNDKGQLGTGDLIDRPQPVKLFGSEILGSFHYPKRPLDRMFSGLIKLVYWEYLNYLQNLFGNNPYVKARLYTKCGISKRVAQFAQEEFSVHSIQNVMFLKNPQNLNLKDNICDLQLRLTNDYKGPKVINTRIKKLDVYFDEVDYDPQLLSFFPNVEVVKLGGESRSGDEFAINLTHLSNLKCLELDYPFNIEQLPPSLVKLVLKDDYIQVCDLSHLTSLNELVVLSDVVSERLLKRQLSQSIVRLEVFLKYPVKIKVHLLNIKELIIHDTLPTNITEQNFPYLKFIQLIKPYKFNYFNSPLSPKKLINHGLIKCVKLIKNEYLVELSGFPWWIQYSAERDLVEILSDYLDKDAFYH